MRIRWEDGVRAREESGDQLKMVQAIEIKPDQDWNQLKGEMDG